MQKTRGRALASEMNDVDVSATVAASNWERQQNACSVYADALKDHEENPSAETAIMLEVAGGVLYTMERRTRNA
jgi:hypothetical protein